MVAPEMAMDGATGEKISGGAEQTHSDAVPSPSSTITFAVQFPSSPWNWRVHSPATASLRSRRRRTSVAGFGASGSGSLCEISTISTPLRSEERRVGKERRCRRGGERGKKQE